MRRPLWIWILTGIAVTMAAATWWPPRFAAGSPKLWVDKAVASLGKVLPGQPQVVQFRVRNVGNSALRISGLTSSCGCAPPKLASSVVPASSETVLTVAFDVKPQPGEFAHRISFKTNDLSAQTASVVIKAIAEWPVDVDSSSIHFSDLPLKGNVSKQLQFFSPSDSAFDVVEAVPSAAWIHVARNDKTRSTRCIRYDVTVLAQELGPFSESIRFQTTSDKRPSILVPVTGEVVAPRRVSPERIVLGSLPPGATKRLNLVVRFQSDGEAVQSLAIDDPQWSLTTWGQKRLIGNAAQVEAVVTLPVSEGYYRSVLSVNVSGDPRPIQVSLSGLTTGGTDSE